MTVMIIPLLLAIGLSCPVAYAQPKDPVKAKGVPIQKLTKDQGAQRYREGLAQETAGNHHAALDSYLVAGEAGHALAQKKLAEIYDRGSPAAKRDYHEALHWYELARSQGIEFPRPPIPVKGR